MSMNEIVMEDSSVYCSEMKKSIPDKIEMLERFIKERFSADEPLLIIDYGGANGLVLKELLSRLNTTHRDIRSILHDENTEFLKQASEDYIVEMFVNHFTNNHEELKKAIKTRGYKKRKKILILSSVLHEMLSYTGNDLSEILADIFLDVEPDIVYVRDMTISEKELEATPKVNYWPVILRSNPIQVISFMWNWGKLSDTKNFCHYLLKYRYKVNWLREVKENYLSFLLENFEVIMNDVFDYQIVSDKYRYFGKLPFLVDRVKKDFGVEFPCNTHYKAIYEKVH